MSSEEPVVLAEDGIEPLSLQSGDLAIQVSGVSKCFHLYVKPQDRLRQSVYPRLQRMFGRPVTHYAREFWALKEISLQVKKGETLGIIGRNGSGKSTLLQIIAGILQPTHGEVTINGRVAALLELGSGFNPEFTGRENVYINAAIQGLNRAETDAKFEDIASFADIGDFIEQPIKSYSSGMMVRLAFAVQAALEPDILIIDEALAVGDMRFSMKCIRRMRELVEKGTSCLFVSHDMSSIVNFCSEVVWLQDGVIVQSGDPKTVTISYANFMTYGFLSHLREDRKTQEDRKINLNDEVHGLSGQIGKNEEIGKQRILESLSWVDLSPLPSAGMGGATIVQLALRKEVDSREASIFAGGEQVELFLKINSAQRLTSPLVCADFRDSKGNLIFGLNTHFMNEPMPELHVDGYLVLKFGFRMPLLLRGDYSLSLAIADGNAQTHDQHHIINEALVIRMIPKDKRQNHYMVVNEDCYCEVLSYSANAQL